MLIWFRKRNNKGQSALEYAVLTVIALGAFLGIQTYFKRGIQGRWKAAVDDLGDQYDPRVADTDVRHVFMSNTVIDIRARIQADGQWTNRIDLVNSIETKTGTEGVAAF